MGTCLDVNLRILLLNMLGESILHHPESMTITVLISTVRLAVAQFWKDINSLSLGVWQSIIWSHYKLATFMMSLTRHKDEDGAHQNFTAI